MCNHLCVYAMHKTGADDIFVFANSWKNVRRDHPEMPVVLQLQQALHVGGKAMVRAMWPGITKPFISFGFRVVVSVLWPQTEHPALHRLT